MQKRALIVALLLTGIIAGLFVERTTLPPTTEDAREAANQFARSIDRKIPPKPFRYDGCTLFPDRLPFHDLSAACLAHDMRYWLGGSVAERKAADIALYEAITHTGPLGPALAPLMYAGTRLFGNSPVTYAFDAHWGFGWD